MDSRPFFDVYFIFYTVLSITLFTLYVYQWFFIFLWSFKWSQTIVSVYIWSSGVLFGHYIPRVDSVNDSMNRVFPYTFCVDQKVELVLRVRGRVNKLWALSPTFYGTWMWRLESTSISTVKFDKNWLSYISFKTCSETKELF